ncbi:unnamed protein product [Gadus morhua 'NCC']
MALWLQRLVSVRKRDAQPRAKSNTVRSTHSAVSLPERKVKSAFRQEPEMDEKTAEMRDARRSSETATSLSLQLDLENDPAKRASVSEMPSPFGATHEKKIGHRRVDASGETTYKKGSPSDFPPLSHSSGGNLLKGFLVPLESNQRHQYLPSPTPTSSP